jgi:hypothetical protein
MDISRMDDRDDEAADSGGPSEWEPEESPEHEEGGLGAFVSEHPLATLGGALGVGYVLGGGLRTALARRVLRLGVKLGFQLALLPDLERDIAGMAVRLGRILRGVAGEDGQKDS